MPTHTWKEWVIVLVVAISVAAFTWVGLNLGRMLYADWAFLHAVRLVNEQQRQAPQPVPSPTPQGK